MCSEEDDQESVVMPNKNGRSLYVTCLRWRKPVLQQNISSMIVETEKRAKVKTPDELLQVYMMPRQLLHLSRISHISLLKDPRSKDTYQRCHPHQYMNGTTCDLTNQPRETEIFQGEAVWQIINCNVLPKDYKETRVGEEESEIKQIVMVTDRGSPSNDDDLD
ncbi:hypothetical protein M0R45_003080 [Rubus argutus]|uniref:Uncharacterized protein n=1 Tax=Rubus argutus TaxID=59490 RepID=A0AAW1YGY7_RUBAR